MFENKLQVTKECKLIADKAMLVQHADLCYYANVGKILLIENQ